MSDKYDKAIAWLNAQPSFSFAAQHSWNTGTCLPPDQTPASCLFAPVRKRGSSRHSCGCLTQLRSCEFLTSDLSAATYKELMTDERIPKSAKDITPDNLEAFAEWQRRVDKELGRCSTMLE